MILSNTTTHRPTTQLASISTAVNRGDHLMFHNKHQLFRVVLLVPAVYRNNIIIVSVTKQNKFYQAEYISLICKLHNSLIVYNSRTSKYVTMETEFSKRFTNKHESHTTIRCVLRCVYLRLSVRWWHSKVQWCCLWCSDRAARVNLLVETYIT